MTKFPAFYSTYTYTFTIDLKNYLHIKQFFTDLALKAAAFWGMFTT